MKLIKFIPFLAALAPLTHAAAFGRFGTSLDQAKQTSFFTWFHLEQTSADAGVRCFQPSGAKFHDKVKVLVKTNAAGLQTMTLMLQRSFIDGRESPFARDIAKSFLDNGLSEPELDQVRDLYNSIAAFPAGSNVIVGADAPRPKLPSTPTLAYQAFEGQRTSYSQKLHSASRGARKSGGVAGHLHHPVIAFRIGASGAASSNVTDPWLLITPSCFHRSGRSTATGFELMS